MQRTEVWKVKVALGDRRPAFNCLVVGEKPNTSMILSAIALEIDQQTEVSKAAQEAGDLLDAEDIDEMTSRLHAAVEVLHHASTPLVDGKWVDVTVAGTMVGLIWIKALEAFAPAG